MRIYCVSKNTGPSYQSDPVRIVYLGTSISEAEEAVGNMSKYQREPSQFPTNYPELYTGLPKNIEYEMIQYYAADGWWVSIVMFTLEENNG